MKRTLLVSALAVVGSWVACGAPIANISSAQPFTMDGHSVAVSGVTSWPVVLGDDVTTWTAPATLLFADGSTVTLAVRSRAKLTGTAEAPKLTLLAGKLDYKLAVNSFLTLVTDDKNTADESTTGAAPNKKKKAAAVVTGSTGANHGHSAWLFGSLLAIALVGAGLGAGAVVAENNASPGL